MFDESLFPKLPEKKGMVVPVFLSPIVGSGERICVAAVSIIEDTFEVKRAFSKTDFPALSKLTSMIDITVADIEKHLRADIGRGLDTLCPSVFGVSLGEATKGFYGGHQMALRTVFRNHSMFHKE